MKQIKDIFFGHTGNVIHKWHHYLDAYDTYFAKYRDRPIRLLEIGVAHGGSLQMWSEYFHPDSYIVGIDINEACKAVECGNIKVLIGSQDDPAFLKTLGDFDIIIDDGGHIQKEMIASLHLLWPQLNTGGLYVIEDEHTAYLPEYGGGGPGKTILEEHMDIIHQVYGWWHGDIREFTRTLKWMHVTNMLTILEKEDVAAPDVSMQGEKKLY